MGKVLRTVFVALACVLGSATVAVADAGAGEDAITAAATSLCLPATEAPFGSVYAFVTQTQTREGMRQRLASGVERKTCEQVARQF